MFLANLFRPWSRSPIFFSLITIITRSFFISWIVSYVYNVFIMSIYPDRLSSKPAVSIKQSSSGNVYFLGAANLAGSRVQEVEKGDHLLPSHGQKQSRFSHSASTDYQDAIFIVIVTVQIWNFFLLLIKSLNLLQIDNLKLIMNCFPLIKKLLRTWFFKGFYFIANVVHLVFLQVFNQDLITDYEQLIWIL